VVVRICTVTARFTGVLTFGREVGRIQYPRVVSPIVLKPMTETLRVILLEAHKLRRASAGQAEKVEQLYHYLMSPAFSQRVRMMMVSFVSMQEVLNAEKRAIQRSWAKRQTQIDRMTMSLLVVGELQAISQNAWPDLDSIKALALSDTTTNEGEEQ